jgi:hypothetical protein
MAPNLNRIKICILNNSFNEREAAKLCFLWLSCKAMRK